MRVEKKQLSEAFEPYVKTKTVKYPKLWINGLVIVSSSSKDVPPEYGYKKIGYDINQGHKHDFLYLCFKEGLDDDKDIKPITDIKILISDSKPSPTEGYKLIERDLNAGMGGKYVYISYTTDTSRGNPIRGIKIINGNEPDIPAPYGYRKVDGDLKVSRGGDFVYICTSEYFNS